jgi:hypothetical protein
MTPSPAPSSARLRGVVRPGGVVLLHVNATEDRPLRARWRPVARELEKDYVLEETGQTLHFFSEEYLRALLQGWDDLKLELVEIEDRDTGTPFKYVWRVVATRTAGPPRRRLSLNPPPGKP